MKHLLVNSILSVYFLAVVAGDQAHHKGDLTPKLTIIATVEGKAFFLDRTHLRNRSEASSYCASLGMRLAEITSVNQFVALDQAEVQEWPDLSTSWTGGIVGKGIQRYVWDHANSSPSLDLPYKDSFDETSENSLVFFKVLNASYITNSLPTACWTGTLCETLPTNKQNKLYM